MKILVGKIVLIVCLMLAPTLSLALDSITPVSDKGEKAPALLAQVVAPVAIVPSKIGSVDLPYLVLESEFGKLIKIRLIEIKDKTEAKILIEKKKLDTLKKDIEAKFPSYTPKQRDAKSKEFQKRVGVFQKLVRDSEESLTKNQQGETSKILALVEKTISDYGKANDFAIIVIKKDILYIGSGIEAQDLTSIILKAVNDVWSKN